MKRLKEFFKNGIASAFKALFIAIVLILLLMLITIFVTECGKSGLLRVVPKPLRALLESLAAAFEPLRAVLENLIGLAGAIAVYWELSQNKRINEAQHFLLR